MVAPDDVATSPTDSIATIIPPQEFVPDADYEMVPEELVDQQMTTEELLEQKKSSYNDNKIPVKKDIGGKAETKKTAAKKVAKVNSEKKKVPPTATKSIPRKEGLPPLPPPPGPPPSSSSRPAKEEDTMPDWVESWGQEVNEQVDRDLQTMLRAASDARGVSGGKGKTEAGGKGKNEAGGKQRTGWLNKCAALCQAYMDGEWDKCYQLVQKYFCTLETIRVTKTQTIESLLDRTQVKV